MANSQRHKVEQNLLRNERKKNGDLLFKEMGHYCLFEEREIFWKIVRMATQHCEYI